MLQMLRRIVRADLGRRVYSLFPSKDIVGLPETELRGMARGHGGLIRGWGIEFGSLYELVSRDPLYREASKVSSGRSMLAETRRINLFLLVKFFFPDLESRDIAELGVYRAGNVFFLAHLLRRLYRGAVVYALDTYQGMPATRPGLDLHVRGDFSDVSLDELQRAAAARDLENIVFVKGDVRDTLPSFKKRLALAHIDLDIYEPIQFAQTLMWNSLVPGGYLVYDDATTSSCLGATRAAL